MVSSLNSCLLPEQPLFVASLASVCISFYLLKILFTLVSKELLFFFFFLRFSYVSNKFASFPPSSHPSLISLSLLFHIYNTVPMPKTQGTSQKMRPKDNTSQRTSAMIYCLLKEKTDKEENIKFRC